MKKNLKLPLAVVLAAMTTLALLPPARFLLDPFVSVIQDFGVVKALLACFLSIFYRKTILSGDWKQPVRASTLVFALALSACMLLGACYQALGSWDFIQGSLYRAAWLVVLYIGYTALFYTLVETAFSWADRALPLMAFERGPGEAHGGEARAPKNGGAHKVAAFLLDRKPFLIPLAVFLLAWLPYWLLCFPGSTQPDHIVQMKQFLGQIPWSDNPPVFSTLALGWPWYLGRMLYNDSLGLMLCVLLQQLTTASVGAFAMKTIREWGAPRSIRACALAFFALHPIIAFMTQAVMKDTIANALLFAFCAMFLDMIRCIKLGEPFGKRLLAISVVAAVASLMRYNNLFIIILSLIALAFIKQNAKRRVWLVGASLLCLIAVRFLSGALADAFNAAPTPIRELLSVPFQQTARYLREHGGDVTPKERSAIDAVLDYENIAELYDPHLSDPVKFTYKGQDEALPAYFEAWWAMFLRHPGTYIQATLNNTYAYFCPTGYNDSADLIEIRLSDDPLFSFENAKARAEARFPLYLGLTDIMEAPLIGIFINQGCITWILLLFALFLCRKKKNFYLFGFIPALLTLFTCIASPVNGYWRYYLPILMMLPLLFVWTVDAGFRPER